MNRETLRNIKKLSNDKFFLWLAAYAKENYQDGFGDGVESNTMAIMRYLHDEFGWGNTRFSRLIEHAKRDVKAMREGYITPCGSQGRTGGRRRDLSEAVANEIGAGSVA